MTKLIKMVALVFVMAVGMSVSAQEINKKAMDRLEKQVNEMAEAMELTDSQKSEMLELKRELALANKKAGQEYSKGSEELKAARKKNMKTYQAGMKETCSKEQIKTWNAYRKAKNNK